MCDQEKSQSVDRFLKYLGSVDEDILGTVQQIVAALIDR
jgi:hypothetical protein